jgi:hypothetical protein
MTSPKRRWFQWSLRTLFVVVTVFGCWLGWNINILRQRAQMRERIDANRSEANPVRFVSTDEFNKWNPGEQWEVSQRLPLTLRLLGAEPVALIYLPEEHFSQSEIEQVERLFPEALVIPWDRKTWEAAMGR